MLLDGTTRFIEAIEQADREIEGYLQKGYGALYQPETICSNEDIQQWRATPFTQGQYMPERKVVKTNAGDLVRSKSEALIANLLYEEEIPYRYEEELMLLQTPYFPDFTILNPTTKELVIWEHFGLLENDQYARAASQKLATYFLCGYQPMRNLIVTSESSESPLSEPEVRKIIRIFF